MTQWLKKNFLSLIS